MDISDVRTGDPGFSFVFLDQRAASLVLTWGTSPRLQVSGPRPMGLACFAVACMFHGSNPRSHVRKSCGPLAHNFLCFYISVFPHKCIGNII